MKDRSSLSIPATPSLLRLDQISRGIWLSGTCSRRTKIFNSKSFPQDLGWEQIYSVIIVWQCKRISLSTRVSLLNEQLAPQSLGLTTNGSVCAVWLSTPIILNQTSPAGWLVKNEHRNIGTFTEWTCMNSWLKLWLFDLIWELGNLIGGFQCLRSFLIIMEIMESVWKVGPWGCFMLCFSVSCPRCASVVTNTRAFVFKLQSIRLALNGNKN